MFINLHDMHPSDKVQLVSDLRLQIFIAAWICALVGMAIVILGLATGASLCATFTLALIPIIILSIAMAITGLIIFNRILNMHTDKAEGIVLSSSYKHELLIETKNSYTGTLKIDDKCTHINIPRKLFEVNSLLSEAEWDAIVKVERHSVWPVDLAMQSESEEQQEGMLNAMF